MNEDKPPIKTNFDESTLDYKLHQDFFELLFQYIRNYEEAMADFYTDTKAGIKAFKELIKLISFTSAHIKKKIDIEEVKIRRDEIHKSLKQGKTSDARKAMENLAEEIFMIFERTELIPKVKHEEDENAKFWKDEENKAIREVKKGFYDILMFE